MGQQVPQVYVQGSRAEGTRAHVSFQNQDETPGNKG